MPPKAPLLVLLKHLGLQRLQLILAPYSVLTAPSQAPRRSLFLMTKRDQALANLAPAATLLSLQVCVKGEREGEIAKSTRFVHALFPAAWSAMRAEWKLVPP
jgi:hypothetical protein